jgi:hypothetical protein
MKTTNKMDGDAFARNLAKAASSTQDNHIIIAQEAVDLKDEATQSAQSYWMMGWTWDEIESVLEDSEYPKNVITHAIKKTKEYAKKILTEGPFSVLKMGQDVKLVGGEIGRLAEKFADHIMVSIDGIGNVKVSADALDLVATEKLREAYSLRIKAANMLYKLSTDQLEHVSIESQTVDPVLESIDNALSTMASIQQNSNEVKREAAKLHSKWEADAGKWEPKSEEEHDFAQYVQATLTGESQVDSEITDLFHNRLGNALGSLHDELRKGATVTDESIVDFLTNTFPNITDNLEAHLFGIKQRNAQARNYVQQFAKFEEEKGEWTNNALQFAVSSWDLTKEFMEKWEDLLVPRIEKGIQAISAFLMDVDKQQVKASVQKALKTL